ncbi:hypothetical protein [Flexibacterium corallicola]|uniref:hypothetical protein n=1 Tax=Flexibacterium corallicola TaxID=3037259 RepID=UPI00286EC03F|nr:hypothetical protein [Pseudovibrio sp. M1P-2-3]
MAIALKNIIKTVSSMDEAVKQWTMLGFSVENISSLTSDNNYHQISLKNVTIQLFSEKKNSAQPIPFHEKSALRSYLQNASKSSLHRTELSFSSQDIQRDYAALNTAGFGDYVDRRLLQPDNSNQAACLFSRDPLTSEISFSSHSFSNTKTQLDSALATHSNGAEDISSIVLVADNPADHHEYLKALTGSKSARLSSLGLELETGNVSIQVLSPSAYKALYDLAAPNNTQGLQLAAIHCRFKELSRFEKFAKNADPREHNGYLVISPDNILDLAIIAS